MEPWEHGVSDIVRLVRKGELSPSEVVRSLLGRAAALDAELQAWVTLDGDGALAAAKEIEARSARGENAGLLGGVPVGLKDIFCTRGLRTAAGSKLLASHVPTEDATSVARLRAAGAIILGKLHTAEFASADPAPTRNAWNVEHTPGGSSSGSGAAVAAGMVPAATGSQTGGSTLRPAAYNGIVGLKPTYGLISCAGVIPLAWSLDHVGIIARSVEDAALLLEAMAGFDAADPASVRRTPVRYSVEAAAVKPRPRIGLVRGFFLEKCTDEVRRHTEEVADRLRRAGARVQEVSLPPSFARVHDEHRIIITAEAAAFHEARFREQGEHYGPRIAERIRDGLAMSAALYARAMRERPGIAADLEKTAEAVDALLMPATPAPAPRDLTTTGDASFQSPWTYAGLPAIALPSGVDAAGLPLGIQLVGGRWREARLIQVARWCEQALDFRRHPPCWTAAPAPPTP
jgi:aspartyl-tRNA(Asn)/glutamyl-tRNA(Gln) amidotransferase subunit A